MSKRVGWLVIVLVAAGCFLGPAAQLAMACGPGSACCQNACNCGMSSLPMDKDMATGPAVPMLASYDPSLMTEAVTWQAEPAGAAPLGEGQRTPPPRSTSKQKIYDLDSTYRI